jgi:competence protein ComEC
MLLCYNPYLLWDVGFQLSYLAIIGIVALQKPILRLFTFKNKFLFKIWEMLAVTVAAQVATFPVCIYYFHQFPNLFFITNLIAVPLSTVILFAEILLICVAWIPWISLMTGKLIAGMVWVMNALIGFCNGLPFSVTDHIYADLLTTWILYLLLFFGAGWLIYRLRSFLWITGICGLFFTSAKLYARIKTSRQKMMIVYQVPRHQAIDFIHGNRFHFIGDSALVPDGLLKHFHLKPARIALQASREATQLPAFHQRNHALQFFGKKILVIDKSVSVELNQPQLMVDVLLLSKNAKVNIAELTRVIRPKLIVMDASNSLWKIAGWKKDCDELALPCFSVPEQGAFMLDLDH